MIITLVFFISIVGSNIVCYLNFVLHFQMIKQKVYLLLENLNQLRNLMPSADTFGWYLFELIVLLKSVSNHSSSFALSLVNKVTAGT